MRERERERERDLFYEGSGVDSKFVHQALAHDEMLLYLQINLH